MIVIRSHTLSPYVNLAMEDALLDVADAGPPTLFLWQSRDALVVGKNQNPWMECAVDRAKQESCAVARRISGGGTVFHDEGNLNYALLMPRSAYRKQKQFDIVERALRPFGIRAHLVHGSSLYRGDRKFSGNAFCFRKNSALHHGTLLLSADLSKMDRMLAVPEADYETRAIASVRANVMNLREVCPDLNVDQVSCALAQSASREYESPAEEKVFVPPSRELVSKYESWAWVFGRTPRFSVGGFTVEKGLVVAADSSAQEFYVGKPFERAMLT